MNISSLSYRVSLCKHSRGWLVHQSPRAGTSHTVPADKQAPVNIDPNVNNYHVYMTEPQFHCPFLCKFPSNSLMTQHHRITHQPKMSLDLRPLLTNATAEVLQEIVEDHALRAEILWAFVVLLHFAALLPLDPMFVHIFVCLLSWAGGSTRGRVEGVLDWVHGSGTFADCVEGGFYRGLEGRLSFDSSLGTRRLLV